MYCLQDTNFMYKDTQARGWGGEGGGWVGKGGGRGKEGEMTQTLYAHMNKRKKKDTQAKS
jgi:hypothetical protein